MPSSIHVTAFADLREQQINKYTHKKKSACKSLERLGRIATVALTQTHCSLYQGRMENSWRMGGRCIAAASGKPAGGIQCNHACRKLQAWLVLLSEQQVESFAKPSSLEGLHKIIYFFFEIGLKWDESAVRVSSKPYTRSPANAYGDVRGSTYSCWPLEAPLEHGNNIWRVI